MKIYDCFQFYNELDLLDIRLNELNNIVDYFVIVEAELSHNLKQKNLYYQDNKHLFEKFADKIIHIVVKSNEFCDTPMENDKIQRRAILRGIQKADSNDIIMISDLDEIPKSSTLKNFLKDNINILPSVFTQYFFYYYLNTFLSSGGNKLNYGTTLFLKKDIIDDIQKSRDSNLRDHSYNKIPDGGWHFSFLGDKDFVINKIRNFAHNEFNGLTDDQITSFYEKMVDPLGRGDYYNIEKTDDLSILPVYVQENINKFEKYIKK